MPTTDRSSAFPRSNSVQSAPESSLSSQGTIARADGRRTQTILPKQNPDSAARNALIGSNASNHQLLPSSIALLSGQGIDRESAPYYQDSNLQDPVGAAPGHGTYEQPPSGLMMWEWDNAAVAHPEFGEFTQFYEPHGELASVDRNGSQSHPPAQQEFPLSQFLDVGQLAPYEVSIPPAGEPSRKPSLPESINAQEVSAAPTETTTRKSSGSHPPLKSPGLRTLLPSQPPLQQKPGVQAGMKRKATLERSPATSQTVFAGADPLQPPRPKRQYSKSRIALGASDRRTPPPSQFGQPGADHEPSPGYTGGTHEQGRQENGIPTTRKTSADKGIPNGHRSVETSLPYGTVRQIPDEPSLASVLPAGKVFPIQVGTKLFRLSGASISSDSPSYFSYFFGQQLLSADGLSGNIHTLFVDRDPGTFRDIVMHLQGYHIKPRDGAHYVRLYADAQFYGLPRLTQQLSKSEIYVRVGERDFQIPRDLFSGPGNTPNFFTLGFAHFLGTPSDTYPGLDRQSLLRPPSILPPAVPGRCALIFDDLIQILKGYPVNVRDETHRDALLRDARYFNLKGVEQRLLPCEIRYNLSRRESEITIRLDDIRQSGISFMPKSAIDPGQGSEPHDPSRTDTGTSTSSAGPSPSHQGAPPHRGHICYARPYTDETANALIVEIGPPESTRLDITSMRATFEGQTKSRISSLFQVIASKMNLPLLHLPLGVMMMKGRAEWEREAGEIGPAKPIAKGLAAQPVSPANSGVSGDRVRIRFDRDSVVTLDGGLIEWETEDRGDDMVSPSQVDILPPIRRWTIGGRERTMDMTKQWVVQRGQWRVEVQGAEDEPDNGKVEVVLVCVKLVAFSEEWARNLERRFLGDR